MKLVTKTAVSLILSLPLSLTKCSAQPKPSANPVQNAERVVTH